MALAGKRVVVIGGSSGFGLSVAHQAEAAGAELVLAGRDAARLERAGRGLASSPTLMIVDAHDDASLERFFDALETCDHVVSMIGDAMGGGFLDCSIERLRHVIQSKLIANVLIARHSSSRIRAGGSLVFTSAVGGRPQTASGAYIGSIAIDAMVEGLAVEMAPHIRVNAVAPTFTETGMWTSLPPDQAIAMRNRFVSRIPLQRLGTIDEVASAYLYVMQNDFITGQRIAVDGGIRLPA